MFNEFLQNLNNQFQHNNFLWNMVFNWIKYNLILIYKKIHIIQYTLTFKKIIQDVTTIPCFCCERLCFPKQLKCFSNQLL
jgi:hypothetical protein